MQKQVALARQMPQIKYEPKVDEVREIPEFITPKERKFIRETGLFVKTKRLARDKPISKETERRVMEIYNKLMRRLVAVYEVLEPDYERFDEHVKGRGNSKGREFRKMISRIRELIDETGDDPFVFRKRTGRHLDEIEEWKTRIENLLGEANIGLIHIKAKQVKRGEKDEKIAAGYAGIVRAAELYDLKSPTRFSTFAQFQIRAAMEREMKKTLKAIRYSEDCEELQLKISRYQQRFYAKSGRDPEPEEIMKEFGLSQEKMDLLLNLPQTVMPGMIPSCLWRERISTEIGDSDQLDLEYGFFLLDEREQKIIRMRLCGENLGLDETAKRLNLSKQRIYQLQDQAVLKLRAYFAMDNDCFPDAFERLPDVEREYLRLRLGIDSLPLQVDEIERAMNLPKNGDGTAARIEKSALSNLRSYLDKQQ